MKHIAIICNYKLMPERVGGMDYFYKQYNSALIEKDFKVEWFFSGGKSFSFYKDFQLFFAENESVEEKFLKETYNKKYDIIITHFTEICSRYYKIFKTVYPNANIIAVDHNPRPVEGYPLIIKIKKRIKGWLYSRFIDQFIAVSNYSKDHLMHDFGKHIRNRIEVILNGIDVEQYEKKISYKNNNRFIVACHLRKQKGVQYVISAVHRIHSQLKYDFRVDIYGEGPEEEELRNLVREYSLDDKINFKGSVDNLPQIYKNYDYLIHPSLGETYCYSVVEALLVGLPVITTKNAGNVLKFVKEEQNGFLFEEKDVKKLSQILLNICNDSISIDNHSIEKVILPNFSLKRMVENHVNIVR